MPQLLAVPQLQHRGWALTDHGLGSFGRRCRSARSLARHRRRAVGIPEGAVRCTNTRAVRIHSGSHHAPEPAREALLLARPLLLVCTTDLPTQVGRHRCTRSTVSVTNTHGTHTLGTTAALPECTATLHNILEGRETGCHYVMRM